MITLAAIAATATAIILTSCASNPPTATTQATTAQTASSTAIGGSEIEVTIYCVEESYNIPEKSTGGLGISPKKLDRDQANIEANRNAITEIISRYQGKFLSAIKNYNQDNRVPAGQKIDERVAEGLVTNIMRGIDEKHFGRKCTKMTQDVRTGEYTVWVALQSEDKPVLEAIKKETASRLQQMQVQHDAARFEEWLYEVEKRDAEREAQSQTP